MDISNRLKAIVNEIKYDKLVEIGCDHGYIPIYAISTGKIKKAVACDIGNGPLEKARENIANHNLETFIETRLSDGFQRILPGEASTAVIAGMGGMLIIDILQKNLDTASSFEQIILQPQRDTPEVRKKMRGLGYEIENEIISEDNGKYYNIINCQKKRNKQNNILYNEIDYLFGKVLLERRDAALKEFLNMELQKLSNILKHNIPYERRIELMRLINMHKEALECM